MFSSPTPAPGSRAIAASALRGAGLIDRDAQMRDVADKPGGRKGSSKIRSHRPRVADALIGKDRALSSRMLSMRSAPDSQAGPSDSLSIRGASRTTTPGRVRRNGVPLSTVGSSSTVSTMRAPRTKTIEMWREFVKKRYNPESRFLNLESMVDDELVKKYHLSPPGYGGSVREAAVIFKLASELVPEVQTLSLANNRLTGQHLSHLHKYLPKLINLSLLKNNIRYWKDVDFISPRRDKMTNLRELILLENPIRDDEYKNGRGENYKKEMIRRFTWLEVLDQEPITQISFDVPQLSNASQTVPKPSATTFPFEMGGSLVIGVDGALVSNFLVRFFNLFDTQRTALLDVYDSMATFSFSANTSIPARARLEGHHSSKAMPNQRKLEWTSWLTKGGGGSRNLTRINLGIDKIIQSLQIGGEAVIRAICDLPDTKHEIAGPPERFSVDSYPVTHGQGMGLLLIVHGQFTEGGAEGIRSFDRTFMLIPAPAGSRAKLNGWDVVILSDQWTIRGYSSPDAWKPGPMLVQAVDKSGSGTMGSSTQPPALPPQFPPDQQAALATLPEAQRALVVQICGLTTLNVKYGLDCLAGNAWDLQRALANFNDVKATLPREAFL